MKMGGKVYTAQRAEEAAPVPSRQKSLRVTACGPSVHRSVLAPVQDRWPSPSAAPGVLVSLKGRPKGMKLSEEFNVVSEQSPRGFLAIQKCPAPKKLPFIISASKGSRQACKRSRYVQPIMRREINQNRRDADVRISRRDINRFQLYSSCS